MITFIPISNKPNYFATVQIGNVPTLFSFKWNRRTRSYFITVTNTSTKEVLISGKTISSDGYLELNRNSTGLIGVLYLFRLSSGGTHDLGSWADTHTLSLTSIKI